MQILEKIKNGKRFSKWQCNIKKVINVIIAIVMFVPNKIYANVWWGGYEDSIMNVEALYGVSEPSLSEQVKKFIPIVLIIRINSLL